MVISLEDPIPDFTIERDENKPKEMRLILNGPKETPYEGGIFYFDIKFPENYPFKVFKLILLTEIYHPQLRQFLEIYPYCSCHFESIGMRSWSAQCRVRTILNNILVLIKNPIFGDICMAQEFKGKKYDNEFVKKAKDWTLKYAM